MRQKQFKAMFTQKKMKRRSIRNSIRNSMIQTAQQVITRTSSRGGTDAEIRSILRSRSGNEPINGQPDLNYVNAIANAIAAASPLALPRSSMSRGNSRASTPHSPVRVNATAGGTPAGPVSPLPTSTFAASISSRVESPIFDDPLFEYKSLSINLIPPGGSYPPSSNPTPQMRSGPPSSTHSTPSMHRPINPESARHSKVSPSVSGGAASSLSPQPGQNLSSSHQTRGNRSSVRSSIQELEAEAMSRAEALVLIDADCQTPAEWIDHVPLPKVHKLSRRNDTADTFNSINSQFSNSMASLSVSTAKVSPFHKPDYKITPHGHAYVGANRNSLETGHWNVNHQKYQLSFGISSQLISYVYSSMFPEQGCTHPAIDFSFHNSLLSYTKELLLYKYKVASVADKFYKGLIACCISQSSQNPRVRLFSKLCGVSSSTSMQAFDAAQFTSFINMLGILFKKDPWEIRNVMNSKKRDIYRKIVLSVLHRILPTIHLHDAELFQHIVEDITALPVTNSNINMKVLDPQYDTIDIDDLLLMLMEYVELEKEENQELQMDEMKKAKEKISQARKQNYHQRHHVVKH